MNDLPKQLRDLDLGDYEARIYATLLEQSPASATHIAKKCGLSRSSVYTTLATLISKGLVGTTYKNDVKQFVAEDIAVLEEILKKEREGLAKKAKLVEALRESVQNMSTDLQRPHIVFFEGQEGLKKIYVSMMRNAPKNAVRYMLRDEFVWKPEWTFDKEWHARIDKWKKEKNITTKLLVNPSPVEKANTPLYRKLKDHQVRFLFAKSAVQDYGLYIIGDTVAILSIEKNNLVGIQLTNRHLAKNFMSVFEGLWEGGKSISKV